MYAEQPAIDGGKKRRKTTRSTKSKTTKSKGTTRKTTRKSTKSKK